MRKTDLGPIQGGWKMVLGFINGEELSADQIKTGELSIDDDQYHAKLGAAASTSTIKARLIQDTQGDRLDLHRRGPEREDGQGNL